MYDILLEDLRRAVDAVHGNEIERRTNEVKHALLVLEQLQGTLRMDQGGEAAKHLDTLYSIVRAKVLEAHLKSSAELLQGQIALMADVRAAWQQCERDRLQEKNGAASSPSAGPEFLVPAAGQECCPSRDWRA